MLAYILVTIALVISFIWMLSVNYKVKKTFEKYQRIGSRSGITAHEMIRGVLRRNGLEHIEVSITNGSLTDNYNPKEDKIYLSEATYNSTSVAALGVAGHELGHALQYHGKYAPIKARMAFVPVVQFSSKLSFPLLFIGIIISMYATELGYWSIMAGIILYGFVALFALITLPVEYNASKRSKKILYESGILETDEIAMVDEVLDVAAKTYLANFAITFLMFLRLLLIFGRRR